MQREHLETVAHLLDLAGDGQDEDSWGQRFQDHLGAAMRRHNDNLKALTGGALLTDAMDARRTVETLRARLELHEIVAERLEARAACYDRDLAEAMSALRRSTDPLVQEALDFAAAGAEAAPVRPLAATAQGVGHGVDEAGDDFETDMSRSQWRLSCEDLQDLIADVYASRPNAGQMAATSPTSSNVSAAEEAALRGTIERRLYERLAARCAEPSLDELDVAGRAVMDAIQRYAPQCCEVAVFAKILQHGLPENLAMALELQHETVEQLLRKHLEEAYRHRPPQEREALWRVWLGGYLPLSACDAAISGMYAGEVGRELAARVYQLSTALTCVGKAREVKYSEYVEAVLRFQVELTERFLDGFAEHFRKVDRDGWGLVTPAALAELATLVLADPIEADCFEAMRAVKARLTDRISAATFSECVEIFHPLLTRRWEARSRTEIRWG
mmetsp:Transcript_13886/g.39629  ORF Transcript_13886/g.39629 Transcript_13886/m.39629 type:complete len:445 (-) Transcript_13886:161-1495(-)